MKFGLLVALLVANLVFFNDVCAAPIDLNQSGAYDIRYVTKQAGEEVNLSWTPDHSTGRADLYRVIAVDAARKNEQQIRVVDAQSDSCFITQSTAGSYEVCRITFTLPYAATWYLCVSAVNDAGVSELACTNTKKFVDPRVGKPIFIYRRIASVEEGGFD